jgi:hypothetical protein
VLLRINMHEPTESDTLLAFDWDWLEGSRTPLPDRLQESAHPQDLPAALTMAARTIETCGEEDLLLDLVSAATTSPPASTSPSVSTSSSTSSSGSTFSSAATSSSDSFEKPVMSDIVPLLTYLPFTLARGDSGSDLKPKIYIGYISNVRTLSVMRGGV